MYFLSKESELLFEVCIIISRTQHGYLEKFERVYTGWKFFSSWRERGSSLSRRNPISRETRPDFSNFRYGTSAIWRKIPRRRRRRKSDRRRTRLVQLALNSNWRRFFEFPRLFPPASRRLPIFSRCEPFPSRGGKANI